jgi:hypothetical protein
MITQKYIKQYIETNYGQLRHCPKALKKALNKTAKETNLDAQSLFHLLIENEPITSAYTHSYGFHTRHGRDLIEKIQNHYYEQH